MADKQTSFTRGPILMVMCGIPASGKTYLANYLKEWSRHFQKDEVHVLHICYDELIPPDLELQTPKLISPSVEDFGQKESSECDGAVKTGVGNSAWKHYRKEIFNCVERIIQQCQNVTFDVNEESDIIKNACELPSLKDFWQIFYTRTARKDMSCACLSIRKWVPSTHILLIDDNMYYRSMRYKYFLLARKYSLGFMQVYVKCTANVALKRNSLRDAPVDSNTIVTMADKLEPPSPDKYPWEMYSVVLDVNDIGSTSCLTKLSQMLAEAAANPVQPLPEENQELKEKTREANLASIIHQADQIIRRLITNKMTEAKGSGLSKQEMKSLGEDLNSSRKAFLGKLKAQDTSFIYLLNNTELIGRLSNKCSCGLLDNYHEMLTQIQNKEYFQETMKILFESFIKKEGRG